MILIADSGSTKTHWVGMSNGNVASCATQGLNPRLTDDALFASVLEQVAHELVGASAVGMIFFYGAGCGTPESQQRVSRLLQSQFGATHIEVEGDLLGACRAACGRDAGLVGILGTGSNMCYYDGTSIARQRVSTGFILGDEGSGNHIGRRLLKDYLEDRMPKDVSIMFHETYPLTNDQFIDRLYRQPFANRFLASLAPLAAQHQSHPYIERVLDDCFGAFFEGVDYYADGRRLPLHLVGGITHSFAPSLRRVAEKCNVELGLLIADPMERLQRYHRL